MGEGMKGRGEGFSCLVVLALRGDVAGKGTQLHRRQDPKSCGWRCGVGWGTPATGWAPNMLIIIAIVIIAIATTVIM